MHFARAIGLATLVVVALGPNMAGAQEGAPPRALIVGVIEVPPFTMQDENGRWEGLSIAIWERAARALGREFTLREYADLGSLEEAVEAGEVDVAPAIAGSAPREVTMDLSHSYHRSGSAIALPATGSGSGWFGIADFALSLAFLRLIGALLLLWLAAGAAIWLCERKGNRAMFGEGTLAGLGNGVWWAAVTMTTVGYGDKAPRSVAGRTIAIVWMLASIVLISSVTASITTSLTVEELSGRVRGLRDLPDVRVGSVRGSESSVFLREQGVVPRLYIGDREGVQAIVDAEIDAFVYNELVLRYLATHDFPGRVRVLPGHFDAYPVKMALPSGSPLREPLNRALLEILHEGEWRREIERYIGPGA